MDNKRDHKRGRKSQKIACSSVKHVLWLRITIYYFVSVFGLGDTHHCLWKATEVKGVFVILHRQSLFGSINSSSLPNLATCLFQFMVSV